MTNEIQTFEDRTGKVKVMWSTGDSMTLSVASFKPLSDSEIECDFVDRNGAPLGVGSLPVGLRLTDILLSRNECAITLEHVLRSEQFSALLVDRRSSSLTRVALPILVNFFKSNVSVCQKIRKRSVNSFHKDITNYRRHIEDVPRIDNLTSAISSRGSPDRQPDL